MSILTIVVPVHTKVSHCIEKSFTNEKTVRSYARPKSDKNSKMQFVDLR